MDIPLQPLRIPSGWTVEFNDGFYEIDPSAEVIPEDKHIWFFKEDMLLLTHNHYKRSLAVGWFPEGNLQSGENGLVFLRAIIMTVQFTNSERVTDMLSCQRLSGF